MHVCINMSFFSAGLPHRYIPHENVSATTPTPTSTCNFSSPLPVGGGPNGSYATSGWRKSTCATTNWEVCANIQEDSELHRFTVSSLNSWRKFVPTSDGMLRSLTNPCWKSSLELSPSINMDGVDWYADMHRLFSQQQAKDTLAKAEESMHSSISNSSGNDSSEQSFYCIPRVYQAGFRKCGTTSLFTLLTAHPLVVKRTRKEGHFWDKFIRTKDRYQRLSVLYYLSGFASAANQIKRHPKAVTVDASCSTAFSTPDQHFEKSFCLLPYLHSMAVPQSKYIFIMRNPVDQMWSNYWAFCKCDWNGNSSKILSVGPKMFHLLAVKSVERLQACLASSSTLDEEYTCLEPKSQRLSPEDEFGLRGCCSTTACHQLTLSHGLYYYHLARWLSVHPRNQFLFLHTEDMHNDPNGMMKQICDFLNFTTCISPTKGLLKMRNYNKVVHQYATFKMLPETRKILHDFYHPYNLLLSELLQNDSFLWSDV